MNVYYSVMRTIDEDKRARIQQAVFSLTATEGLTGLAMSKVAKTAGVSPATIYIYYNDKEDMLSRIYEQVKTLFDAGLHAAIDAAPDLDAKIRAAEWHYITQFRQYPEQARFVDAVLANEQAIDAKAKAFADDQAQPLTDLFAQVQAAPAYRPIDALLGTTLFSVPLQMLKSQATDAQLNAAIDTIIAALKR
ncbi:TetR/AcrR family transcriptional regulator [Lacticaseibacillus yichunensis]|uniref:TetR/AcrR family transcriptional regulator n=2 Tax=Lacticaseibacillus yichunensis TaxID=2486015 RepID=A0ABW4CP29_9LACO